MALIICGHQRSGTTILQALFNQHPEISMTLEMGNFRGLNHSFPIYSLRLIKRVGNIWWKINWPYSKFKYISIDNFTLLTKYLFYLFQQNKTGRIGIQAIETSLKKLFPTARVVGDKWPDYIYLLDTLTQAEGLNFIVIYRDCRDVANSTLKMAGTQWRNQGWVKSFDSAEKIANRWVKAIEMMERHQKKIYTIQYEKMVQNPNPIFQELGEWLGVDPKGFPIEAIQDKSIGKYKNGLTKEEIDTVIRIAGPTMERLGYL